MCETLRRSFPPRRTRYICTLSPKKGSTPDIFYARARMPVVPRARGPRCEPRGLRAGAPFVSTARAGDAQRWRRKRPMTGRRERGKDHRQGGVSRLGLGATRAGVSTSSPDPLVPSTARECRMIVAPARADTPLPLPHWWKLENPSVHYEPPWGMLVWEGPLEREGTTVVSCRDPSSTHSGRRQAGDESHWLNVFCDRFRRRQGVKNRDSGCTTPVERPL